MLPRAEVARAWDLGGDPTTIGVRMPHDPLALAEEPRGPRAGRDVSAVAGRRPRDRQHQPRVGDVFHDQQDLGFAVAADVIARQMHGIALDAADRLRLTVGPPGPGE